MKKVLKIVGIILLLFIAILIAIPFVLESKIDTIVQNYADENLNAELTFDDISLSLISSFPKAEISVDNLKITNRAPFEGETLATAKSLSFEMGVMQLLKGTEEPLEVNEIIANELLLILKTNKTGAVNYDIVKESETEAAPLDTEASSGFSFDINNYELNNSAFTYIDDTSNMAFYLTEINHKGTGIFSGGKSELDTNTEANVTFAMDSTEYLSNNSIKLDALIDLDLEQQKYTFKENKAYINALPLEFDGFVQLVEAGQQIDITFKNPEASFKDFLAVIPKAYAKDIENVITTGNFTVNGIIKGLVSEETIPTLDINLNSSNASFKFPDLPKSVRNIAINASVKNTTGNVDDTFVNINKLNFQIDEDVFKSEASIKNLTKNMFVAAKLDGVLNLANITKAYPIELENELSGILKGNVSTSFDMNAIETNAYQRIKNVGSVSLSNFVFSSEDIVNPIQINKADLTFKPGTVSLNSFDALTGQSDFSATGTITNLLGFLLSDKKLEGNFNVNSNTFAISDFMVEDETASETSNKTTSETESLKIPAFLDCTITANAKTVIYDNLNLKNVKGQLLIKDQNANLKNMTTDIFNGQLGISGNVSTKSAKPSFDMKLGMQNFDISQSFKDLEMLKALAPIANVLQGKLNSTIDVSGFLDESFSPDLSTMSGNALAEILTDKVDTSNSPLLTSLDSKLDFIDFNKLDLKDIKTNLSFENGQVSVKPFTINYKDIPIEVSGSHSFSNTMNYSAVLQVPAKYLGSEVNRLIGKINDNEVNNLTVPITASIGGTFASPNIKTDLTSGVTNLTNQLIEIEKQKLIGKGKDKVTDLLGGLLGGNSTPTKTDSTSTKEDTTKSSTEDKVKEGVGNILGGLLGGKKKTSNKKATDSTKN
ncbi:AsmA-like C-terminal region-containing protein [Winogradskyella psychrotolerans]|uniref:AsmA-like C-terminal region-containing protein n=1 Tax=Winogradskyella psychrotolerans TaxID=1344585 RepID=UPI001C06BD75|nr:AsmA-like C-terminal region-containing protein [Winogradskyella psychrotolerans]MBU2922760.1 AsmA-like C-terminal region-containing protein [Winogradskyella psychrotolerans]